MLREKSAALYEDLCKHRIKATLVFSKFKGRNDSSVLKLKITLPSRRELNDWVNYLATIYDDIFYDYSYDRNSIRAFPFKEKHRDNTSSTAIIRLCKNPRRRSSTKLSLRSINQKLFTLLSRYPNLITTQTTHKKYILLRVSSNNLINCDQAKKNIEDFHQNMSVAFPKIMTTPIESSKFTLLGEETTSFNTRILIML
jgi:hypothetical protein